MKLFIINQTSYMYGAHATTMLINTYVNSHLGDYGPGIEEVHITIVYPPKTVRSAARNGFGESFWKIVDRCPSVRFLRAKRRVDILSLCSDVSVRSIQGDGHLTKSEATKVALTTIAGLQLMAAKIKTDDQFDFETFLIDATRILIEVPDAMERYLQPE
ncbi:MAG: hypothetical protein ACRC8S_00780 [Fimbriiglobus sp.]